MSVAPCQPDIAEKTYFEIIRKKTAILHSVACELGGAFGGLDPASSVELGTIGLKLGMAFQVIDDCLDYAGQEEIVGKSLGSDLRQGKLTLPLLYLRDALQGDESSWLRNAITGPTDADTERRIHERVIESGALSASFARAGGFVEEARETLRGFEADGIALSTPEKESLELAAGYVLNRQS